MTLNEHMEALDPLPEGALDQLTYLVGTARGGTTILTRAIGTHPGILGLPEPTHFLNEIWRYRDVIHTKLLQRIYQAYPYYRSSALREQFDGSAEDHFRRLVHQTLRSGDLARMWKLYPLVYALDEQTDLRPDSIRCWIDKETNPWGLQSVADAFPEARYVFITRDPRGAVASLAKRNANPGTPDPRTRIEPVHLVQSALYWRDTMQKLRSFTRTRPDAVLWIRFEDFLRDPPGTLNHVYEHLDVDLLPEEEIDKRLGELEYGATNAPSETGSGIRTDPIDRWKDQLTAEQASLVQHLTHPTAEALGYDLGSDTGLGSQLAEVNRVEDARLRLKMTAKVCLLNLREMLAR